MLLEINPVFLEAFHGREMTLGKIGWPMLYSSFLVRDDDKNVGQRCRVIVSLSQAFQEIREGHGGSGS